MGSATPLVAHCTNASRGLSAIAQFLIMHDIERWRLYVKFVFNIYTKPCLQSGPIFGNFSLLNSERICT